jgi:glycosyltransferase involved in cell wall biosynthesis
LRVVQLFNQQRSHGGEETAVLSTVELLRSRGVETKLLMATSRGIENGVFSKLQAAGNGIYSISSRRQVTNLLREFQPDVMHAHNLYPLLSPSVLAAGRRAGVPVVYSVHSQILTCPTWYNVYDGRLCERCFGGREYSCILQNCRGNLFESVAYAARSASARKLGLIAKNVTLMITGSEFMRDRLSRAGYERERIAVIPNKVDAPSAPTSEVGSFVLYVGRLSQEKGIDVLLAAAAKTPEILYRVAGSGPERGRLESKAPSNVRFEGWVDDDGLAKLYRHSRVLVVPSITYEVSGPTVLYEAMAHGVPTIGSRIGGIVETVVEGETGELFDPGNVDELVDHVRAIWTDPVKAANMGRQGRERALEVYSSDRFFGDTMAAYDRAKELDCARPQPVRHVQWPRLRA